MQKVLCQVIGMMFGAKLHDMIGPFIIKNFASEDEIEQLNLWTINNYKKHFFLDANMGIPGTRLSTRYFNDCSQLNFPKETFSIKQRIINVLDLKNFKMPGFCHGIVNGIGFNDGDIYEHTDPVWHENTYTLHCNIISQKPEVGGVTYIEGEKYETDPRDLLVYPVSEKKHNVDTIRGETPRILWVFGFCIER
jgi:hypothetical protein